MRKASLSVLRTVVVAAVAASIATTPAHAEPQEGREKPLTDALITELPPHITQAITNYYGYPKPYALFWSRITDIKREIEGGYSFLIRLEVVTYEHAHSNPFGTKTITFSVSPSGTKLMNYTHKGDEWEARIQRFEKDILEDIVRTFHLVLSSYSKYTYRQLEYLSEKESSSSFRSLFTAAEEMRNELTEEAQSGTGYKNVINPLTFVKADEAFILYKQADGSNHVWSAIRVHGAW